MLYIYAGPLNGAYTWIGIQAILTDWKYALVAAVLLGFVCAVYRADPMTNDPQYDP